MEFIAVGATSKAEHFLDFIHNLPVKFYDEYYSLGLSVWKGSLGMCAT